MNARKKPEEEGGAASFEAALKRLEEIVETLEGGESSLDESVALYEEGVKLFRYGRAQLEAAQKKVEELTEESGETPLPPALEEDDE